MKRLVIIFVSIATVSLFVLQANAQNHWYWLLDSGNYKLFVNVDDPKDTVEIFPDGNTARTTILRANWSYAGNLIEGYAGLNSVDAEGRFWHHGLYEPNYYMFTTPYIYCDSPLEVGMTWECDVVWSDGFVHHYQFEVIGEYDITVPYGTYHCFSLHHRCTINGAFAYSFVWYLNDGVGAVKYTATGPVGGWGSGTYELSENAVIPDEKTTWGAVKTLYK